jgi:hypothetical protein
MSNPTKMPPPVVAGPRQNAGNDTAVKIVAIVAAVLLVIFLVCSGIVFAVSLLIKKSWDQNVQAFVERADEQAEKAQAWHQQNVERAQAEWAKQNAARNDGKQFAESFLTALREHRFADAYRETTASFQKQYSSEQELEQFALSHTALSRAAMLMDDNFAQQGAIRQQFFFTTTEGEMLDMKLVKVVVAVVKEGLNWKADELSISENAPFGMPKS